MAEGQPPRRKESLISRYPWLGIAILVVLVYLFGPSLLRAAADIIENPFGEPCPSGMTLIRDRLSDECR